MGKKTAKATAGKDKSGKEEAGETATRVLLNLTVRPSAPSTGVQSVGDDGEVRLTLAAPPSDGEANAELVRFLSKSLGVPRSDLEIVRGHKSRQKVVALPPSAELSTEAALDLLRRQV